MAIHESSQQPQETWIPYEEAKDCSQGFCSIYCPQWCSIIFPPPPPYSFIDEDSDSDSSSTTPFSPLVIAIIGILASAFLLISYYTIISKYCGGFRRRSRHNQDDHVHDDDDDGEEMGHQESANWHMPPSHGLDQALINKISVYKYKRNDGVVEGTDCSVCLGEFREEESLRLLPKCSHAFHLQCIDTWLSSHSNCPLCRANIVSVINCVPPPCPSTSVVEESGQGNEEAVAVEESSVDYEESSNSGGNESHKETLGSHQDNEHDVVIDIKDEECMSDGGDDGMCRERVSIGDILKINMEEEFVMFNSGGSSSKTRGENSKGAGCDKDRSLHCVMSPMRMKRTMSSGRLGFSRQGRGRNALVLPI